jgi:hypothetical protein
VARAQQGDRVRRIGVLLNKIADDPLAATERSVFVDGLQQFGWIEGGNVLHDVAREWHNIEIAMRGRGEAAGRQNHARRTLASPKA